MVEILSTITSLTPHVQTVGIALVGLFGVRAAANYFSKFWVQSNPNEWLLVIENGILKKAGVGLKCFIWPNQTHVSFPSAVERVSFNANNVTKEMQGLEVSGFAIWSVHREGDGPFKCYKYTQGGNANENVRIMCESIVRHQIANHTLQEVLTNRNMLRDSMKVDLQKQLSGWGIWLETVEITEVKICSRSLFEDLQAEFRQEAHLKAEHIRLETYNKVEANKMESELLLSKQRNDTETQRIKYQSEEALKRKVQEAAIYKQQCDLDIEKLKKEQLVKLEQVQSEYAIVLERKKKEQEKERVEKEFEIEMFKKTVEADKLMDSTSLQKYIVDSTERIYSKLPLREISVNSYVGPENTSNISSLLPAMGMIMQQQAAIKK